MRFIPLFLLASLFSFSSCDSGLQSSVRGPDKKSDVDSFVADSLPQGDEKAAVVLFVTDKDSHWPDFLSALKDIGLPIRATGAVAEALNAKMMIVYPYISGKVLAPGDYQTLTSYVARGGALIGINPLGNGFKDMFGFQTSEEGRSAKSLTFVTSPDFMKLPLTEEEKNFKLKNRGSEIHIGSTEFKGAKNVIARFDSGNAGIIAHRAGKGQSLAIGFDLGDITYLAHTSRGEELVDPYVNTYSPVLDTFLFLIRDFYLGLDKENVVLGLFPGGSNLATLITHDIDFKDSLDYLMSYAEEEKKVGVTGTYFIQTKYVKDFSEDVFFSQTSLNRLKRLRSMGNEIGSHSVSHSKQFREFDIGTGQEFFPEYRPFVEQEKSTKGATILGELRVSKFLLDILVPPEKILSFRAGHLKNPDQLPQALRATKFRFDSSGTANSCLTHFPVQLSYNSRGQQMLPIYRFPVTIEDEETPMQDRVEKDFTTCRKIARRGGLCNVLVHPNKKGKKMEAVVELSKKLSTLGWTGTMQDLGNFWRTRHEVTFHKSGKALKIHSKDLIKGLAIESKQQFTRSTPENLILENKDGKLVLGEFSGEVTLE